MCLCAGSPLTCSGPWEVQTPLSYFSLTGQNPGSQRNLLVPHDLARRHTANEWSSAAVPTVKKKKNRGREWEKEGEAECERMLEWVCIKANKSKHACVLPYAEGYLYQIFSEWKHVYCLFIFRFYIISVTSITGIWAQSLYACFSVGIRIRTFSHQLLPL